MQQDIINQLRSGTGCHSIALVVECVTLARTWYTSTLLEMREGEEVRRTTPYIAI
jgi:hypothetical protein